MASKRKDFPQKMIKLNLVERNDASGTFAMVPHPNADSGEDNLAPDHVLDLEIKRSLKNFIISSMDAIFSIPDEEGLEKLDQFLLSFRYLKAMNQTLKMKEVVEQYKSLLLEACQNGNVEEITKAYDEYVLRNEKAISQEVRNFARELQSNPYNGFLFIKMKLPVAYTLEKEIRQKLMEESILVEKKEEVVVWMLEVSLGLTILHEVNQVAKLSYTVEGNNEMVFFDKKGY